MIDSHFEGRSSFRHYSRLPDPWRPEDDSGRSPPQFCFSLSWLDSSSTAAPTSRFVAGVGQLVISAGLLHTVLVTSPGPSGVAPRRVGTLTLTYSCQAGAEQFQQCAEFRPVRMSVLEALPSWRYRQGSVGPGVRQQIFETVPVRHRGTSFHRPGTRHLDRGRLA
jgi:hypothetical protein